jgi:NAD(P)-dependent dehydrogenase (short-subunit alcohol dehydrogenase family)
VRSVIITGVSQGLGAALFDEFLSAGDRILALGRRFTDAQHVAERTRPQQVRLRQVDLVYPAALPTAAELSSFVHDAAELVLIHNAAVLGPVGAVGTLSPQEIQTAVTVNLTAPMLLTNALLAADTTRRGLTVLFISSGAARRRIEGWAVYGATKLAAESYFDALAAEHEGDARIRVVNVNPGVMDTQMQERVREHARRDGYFPERERYLERHDRGDLAAPATVARSIVAEHLGSPQYLTQR